MAAERKRKNCHWVAVCSVSHGDGLLEVSFTVSDRQMDNWKERPRSGKTIRNYCYMVGAALERKYNIKRRINPEDFELLHFEPRDKTGYAARQTTLPPEEASKPKPAKPVKGQCEGQGVLGLQFEEAV